MSATRREMMSILRKEYPNLFMRTYEEFKGMSIEEEGGIWSSAECDIESKNGFRLFDYYSEDFKEKNYILGVHHEISDILNNNGWYAEWHDGGTIMFFPI